MADEEFTEQIGIRMTPELREKLEADAKHHERPVSAHIRFILRQYLASVEEPR